MVSGYHIYVAIIIQKYVVAHDSILKSHFVTVISRE